MTETSNSFRLVQSGKVYRQMFDAEVQLMKSLNVSRQKKSLKGNDFILPEIKRDSLLSDRSDGGLTAQNTLTKRQVLWKNGLLNDYKTENPVRYRQLKISEKIKQKKTQKEIEVTEVCGLPEKLNQPEKSSQTSNVIDRIREKCQIKYDECLNEMFEKLNHLSEEVQKSVQMKSISLRDSLQIVDDHTSEIYRLVSDDESVFEKSYEDLKEIWEELMNKIDEKMHLVDDSDREFQRIEDQRIELITDILHKYSTRLMEMAAIPPPETRRHIDIESMLLNQTMLANRRAYAQLRHNMKESVISEQINLYLNFQQWVSKWRKKHCDRVISKFTDYMKSSEVSNPSDVDELNEIMKKQQNDLVTTRSEVLNQLKIFKPPVATKPSVYKWNSSLSKAQQNLEDLHRDWLKNLHKIYEDVCQDCLNFADQCKRDLIQKKICEKEEASKIVSDQFLTHVGNQLKVFELKLQNMEEMIESASRQNEKELHQLFQFVQGAAHLWDLHEINLARKERQLENKLDKERSIQDKENEEKEARLDMILDRLRQENSSDSLNTCLNVTFNLLEDIKAGYNNFYLEQRANLGGYPLMIAEELESYHDHICRFFGLSKPTADGDDVTDDKIDEVQETITTPGGAVYIVEPPKSNDDNDVTEEEITQPHDVMIEATDQEKPLPPYIDQIPISHDVIEGFFREVRFAFLGHFEIWGEELKKRTDEEIEKREQELKEELDLRLHLHMPRHQRIQHDICDVRLEELRNHQDRVDRHCDGVVAAMTAVNMMQSEFIENQESDLIELKTQISAAEDRISKLDSLAAIEKEVKNLRESAAAMSDAGRKNGKLMRKEFARRIALIRDSNRMCIRSFKVFSDGGSFSPSEASLLKDQVEAFSRKLESAAKPEVEIERRCDHMIELANKFEERMKMQMNDVKMLDLSRRLLLNAQVRLRSHVTYTDRSIASLRDHVTQLKRQIDACEHKHVDKEEVTTKELWTSVTQLMTSLEKQRDELDSALLPSPEKQSEDQKMSSEDLIVKNEDSTINVIKNILKIQTRDKRRSIAVREAPVHPPVLVAWQQRHQAEVEDFVSGERKLSEMPKRDPRLDERFYPFGFEAPKGNDLLSKICLTLFNMLEALFSTADDYYKHKSFRHSSRTLLQDNFEGFCEGVLNKALLYFQQASNRHQQLLKDFRTLLEECEMILGEVPRLCSEELFLQSTEKMQNDLKMEEEEFMKTKKMLEAEKEEHKRLLRPTLGHPEQKDRLQELNEKEARRQNAYLELIKTSSEKSLKHISKRTNGFTRALITSSKQYIAKFEKLLCVDDVIIPEINDSKKTISSLVKQEKESSSHPIINRGNQSWSTGDGDVIKTKNSVLPQQCVVVSRDRMLAEFLKLRDHLVDEVKMKSEKQADIEEKWMKNWMRSIEEIRMLYQ